AIHMAMEAWSVVVGADEVGLAHAFGRLEVMRLVAVLACEALVRLRIFASGIPGRRRLPGGRSDRGAAALLLGVPVFSEVNGSLEFLAHAVKVVGLVVPGAFLLAGMAIHAGFGFCAAMREDRKALRMAFGAIQLAVVRIAELCDIDG